MSLKKAFLYVLWLSLLATSYVSATSFTATIDRTQLNEGESVELTLESDDTSYFAAPDLTPLKPFFELLSSKQVNRFSTLSGQARPINQWILTLLPKQTGSVVIPPLRLGSLQSAPINLYVKEQPVIKQPLLAPVYIDTQLDQEQVYIQAQAVLTLRIFHAIPLFSDGNLTPLLLDNARVEPMGKPRTFEQHINGVRHGVIEVRYAIFPQQSGVLDIPAQTFSATLAGHDPQSLTPFSARPGQRIEVKSARIPLHVKDIPDSYPAHATWLPARQVTLQQQWIPALAENLIAGTAVTRMVSLQVDGLTDSQLPRIDTPVSSTFKVYVDKPSLSRRYEDDSIVSRREERQAFVFESAGQYNLAASKLPWWNTLTDQLEYAELPQQNFTVKATALTPSSTNSASIRPPQNMAMVSTQQLRIWQMLSLLLSILALSGFALWWRARHQPAVVMAASSGPSSRSLQDDLRKACLANDPIATRQALDAWARQHPESLADMAARDETLSQALDTLNSALYSENDSDWQGKPLWLAISQLSFNVPLKSSNSDDQLPPLYPP
jgi:hypothetical protein